MKLLVFALAIAFLVSACGGNDPYEVPGQPIGHGYYIVQLPWNGRYVNCIKWSPDAHQGGLTCDFGGSR